MDNELMTSRTRAFYENVDKKYGNTNFIKTLDDIKAHNDAGKK